MMQRITAEAYAELLRDGEVLSSDGYGEKVLLAADGLLIKAFRLKRPWSSGRWKSYAVRFAENAVRLHRLGVPTVIVERVANCAARKRHLVFYRPLAGTTLRDALQGATPEETTRLLLEFAGFLAELHQLGVYFRSIHFGNVVVPHGPGRLGLIDVADMRFRDKPLNATLRARNFRHLARYEIDRNALQVCGAAAFLRSYLAQAGLAAKPEQKFLKQLQRDLPLFATPPGTTNEPTRSKS